MMFYFANRLLRRGGVLGFGLVVMCLCLLLVFHLQLARSLPALELGRFANDLPALLHDALEGFAIC